MFREAEEIVSTQELSQPVAYEAKGLALREGERSVTDLAEAIGATQPLVSQHLAVLRNQGLLRNRRNGNEVYYSIAYQKMIQVCDLLREVLFEHLSSHEELSRRKT